MLAMVVRASKMHQARMELKTFSEQSWRIRRLVSKLAMARLFDFQRPRAPSSFRNSVLELGSLVEFVLTTINTIHSSKQNAPLAQWLERWSYEP